MDRVTIFALLVAGGSVLVSGVSHGNIELTVRHGFSLIVPIAIIAFPEMIEFGFRRSWGGRAHGGEDPVPATVIRVAAWLLLIAMVVAHHYLAFAGVALWWRN